MTGQLADASVPPRARILRVLEAKKPDGVGLGSWAIKKVRAEGPRLETERPG